MKNFSQVFISIGSNMGDRYANCITGIDLLNSLETTSVTKVSSFYYTQPVDFTDQDWFVNGALELETGLDPFVLMTYLKQVENQAGQFEKSVRFGPRILDLDIIFFGNQVLNHTNLTLPHPRMDKRCFVLKPLCDIAPEFTHPVSGEKVEDLLKKTEHLKDQKVMIYNFN
ncbi:MAG: 2-amino-4-hydroxy-6-hydroxymethyldihydropteridine diphosphokinase [Thermodesulfobacteriota bacterium]|nr:2-amino-4-hydroxy-6-hydroxymethyldihydropteridine diphosphokinase [Thermodesulfobacteriota bacterium]